MKLLLEFSEFSHMRLGSGDSIPQSTHVDNPKLSLDGFDRFSSNLRNSLSRLNQIYKDINKTNIAYNLRSGSLLEIEDIKHIKILRIYPKDDIYWNIYFTFILDETEYYGVIYKINSENPLLKSEFFNNVVIQGSKEWIIRVKGLLIKTIKQWLIPLSGEYLSLKDIDVIDSSNGELTLIEKNSIIKVIRTIDNTILITFNGQDFIMKGKNYFYFNYYFKKTD